MSGDCGYRFGDIYHDHFATTALSSVLVPQPRVLVMILGYHGYGYVNVLRLAAPDGEFGWAVYAAHRAHLDRLARVDALLDADGLPTTA